MTHVPLKELTYFVRNVLSSIHLRHTSAPTTHGAFVLALKGNVGAGKTTFVQSLGKELRIDEQMQSPTYVLMKSYEITWDGFEKLIHIDAYRLESPKEFNALRPSEFLDDPKALICIEWPEKLEGVLPKPDMEITFTAEGAENGERYIDVV